MTFTSGLEGSNGREQAGSEEKARQAEVKVSMKVLGQVLREDAGVAKIPIWQE